MDLDSRNGETFSFEFASILRDSGSAVASVLDAVVKGKRGEPALRTDFGDYRKLLVAEDPDIARRTVQVQSLVPGGWIVPFSSLAKADGTPGWWSSYNRVKHSEYDHFHLGNLGYATVSVAALLILEYLFGLYWNDPFWMYLLAHAENAPDKYMDRRLFPSYE